MSSSNNHKLDVFTPEIDALIIQAVKNPIFFRKPNSSSSTSKQQPTQSSNNNENQQLQQRKHKYTHINWSKIQAQLFPHTTFTGTQIRQRYCREIDPAIVREPFTKAEDKLLIENAPKYNYSWSILARIVFNDKRTDAQVRHRFATITGGKLEYKSEAQQRKAVKQRKMRQAQQNILNRPLLQRKKN